MPKPTDEALVSEACSAPPGDLRAFEALMERHQTRVQTNCRHISGSEEDALDLSQEVFVKAYFNLDRFAGRATFGTWLGRIKVNHCLNHLRRRRGLHFVDIDDPELNAPELAQPSRRADGHLERRGMRERITAVLDEMGDTLRIPLIMRDLDGMSYEEIARRLDLSLSATKMRIKRAREQFRDLYENGRTDD